MRNMFSAKLSLQNNGRKWLQAMMSAALACVALAPSGTAICDQNQVHPFSPQSILYYDVNNSASQNGIYVGGAAGIDQGHNADCWFESALAAIARYEPGARLISEMIVEAPGGYEVTFQDQPARHFLVTKADLANLHIKDKATWADVVEAAGVKRFPAVTHGDSGDARLSSMLGEKLNAFGLTVMTGHQSDLIETNDVSTESLVETLTRGTMMRMPMTAGSHPKSDVIVPQVVVPAHVYTILNYDPWTGIVTLRNPWGNNHSPALPDLPLPGQEKGGVRDLGAGVIQVHIKTFPKYFHTVARSRLFHL